MSGNYARRTSYPALLNLRALLHLFAAAAAVWWYTIHDTYIYINGWFRFNVGTFLDLPSYPLILVLNSIKANVNAFVAYS